jgi:hypothetical protein
MGYSKYYMHYWARIYDTKNFHGNALIKIRFKNIFFKIFGINSKIIYRVSIHFEVSQLKSRRLKKTCCLIFQFDISITPSVRLIKTLNRNTGFDYKLKAINYGLNV